MHRALTQTAIVCLAAGWLTVCGSLHADDREPEVQTLQPGVRLSLVAEHPLLATPTGIDVDSQNRVWVVATHTHFRPDDYVGPEHDEVLIFTDRQANPNAPVRHVFYNATVATMDLELGPDGWVYLAERDRILRIKDTEGDNQADVEQDVAVLQTEADYPHNGLSGLAWHPSGDLIFALGENYAKPWKLTGLDGNAVEGIGEGGIFRCTADGRQLRRIARGFWNPFGVCVRTDGEIFAVENDPGERPPCRLLHIVEGGDYGYQRLYGNEAHHPFVCWNGELRGTLPMLHPSGEAPCGVLPLGRGLLVPSWSDHRIDFFKMKRQGASFAAQRMALVKGSRYFRPACIASQGSVAGKKLNWYLTDWVDGRYQAHGFGRLWRLEIDLEQASWVGPLELEPATDAARLADDLRSGRTQRDRATLLSLAQQEDPFVARAALLALARQTPQWSVEDVRRWPEASRIQAVLALKLAEAAPQEWVPALLADPSAEVQFETLRWIADAGFQTFLPEVQQIIERSDLDYRRYEAAIATWNRLTGTPEAGVRNTQLLLDRVQDADSTPRLRAYALRLLPSQPRVAPKDGGQPVLTFPKGLSLDLLKQLLAVKDPTLSLEVVRTLAGNPLVTQQLLARIAADPSHNPTLRSEAVAGLAAVAEQHVPLLLELAGTRQKAVREEALRCLRAPELSPDQRSALQELADRYPGSADLFQSILAPKTLAKGRPPLEDTAAWLNALATIDAAADPQSGRRIFYHSRLALCSNCHRRSGRGNVVGPDLSAVGARGDRTWLLRSILDPSREIAPQYQPRRVLLKDGRTFTGIRLRSSTREAMRDANGQNRTFDRDEIESMVELPTSFMPTELVKSLTNRELRDLIAFLEENPHP